MKVRDYEYNGRYEETEITKERKEEIIEYLKDNIRKNYIPLSVILKIVENNSEYNFIFDWLDNNDIALNGKNGTLSGEFENYNYIKAIGVEDDLPEPYSKEETEKIFKEKIEKGDLEAKKDFALHNIKLAYWVTNWSGINRFGIDLEDKKQMSIVGLMRAIERFDVRKGVPFASYATRAIYREIVRQYYEDNLIKRDDYKLLNEIEEVENILKMKNGSDISNEDIAKGLNISLKRLRELQKIKNMTLEIESLEEITENFNNEEERISELGDSDKVITTGGYSIKNDKVEGFADDYIVDGVYIDEADDDNLKRGFVGHSYSAEYNMDPEKVVSSVDTKNRINETLDTLTEREKLVLKLRHGLEDGIRLSREKTGKYFDVTAERIRQIEGRAYREMRDKSRVMNFLAQTRIKDIKDLKRVTKCYEGGLYEVDLRPTRFAIKRGREDIQSVRYERKLEEVLEAKAKYEEMQRENKKKKALITEKNNREQKNGENK